MFGLCQAQKNEDEPLKSYYKVGIFWIPGFSSVSFNYEKQIRKYSSLELSANLFVSRGEFHNTFIEAVYLSYRQYTTTNHRFLRSFWAEPYISYIHLHQTNYKGEAYKGKFDNAFGLGLAAGKKIFFKKSSRFFIDIGGGVTFNYNISTDQIDCTRTYEFPYLTPRVIFLFGISN
jgi:hypothetical protein